MTKNLEKGVLPQNKNEEERLFPKNVVSSKSINEETRNLGLLLNTFENRALFWEDRFLDWKSRAEVAEERVERLLRLQNEDERKLNLKLSNMEIKINSISRTKDVVPDRELSPERNTKIKVRRRWKFKDRLQEQTKPKGDSDLSVFEDEWIVLQIPKGNRSYVKVDFVDGDLTAQDTTISDLLSMRNE
jgi:hypothetical protein